MSLGEGRRLSATAPPLENSSHHAAREECFLSRRLARCCALGEGRRLSATAPPLGEGRRLSATAPPLGEGRRSRRLKSRLT